MHLKIPSVFLPDLLRWWFKCAAFFVNPSKRIFYCLVYWDFPHKLSIHWFNKINLISKYFLKVQKVRNSSEYIDTIPLAMNISLLSSVVQCNATHFGPGFILTFGPSSTMTSFKRSVLRFPNEQVFKNEYMFFQNLAYKIACVEFA